MKTNQLFSIGMAVALGAMFASCSTSVDIVKRHHNNGYYIHVASKNKPAPATEARVEQKQENIVVAQKPVQQSEAPLFQSTVVVKETAKPAVPSETMAARTSSSASTSSGRIRQAIESSDAVAADFAVSEGKQNLAQKKFRNTSAPFSMRGDAPAVVLILLCIFLPPLAVGIVRDWNTQFWICLLLWCLGILPGIIYAFFICFG